MHYYETFVQFVEYIEYTKRQKVYAPTIPFETIRHINVADLDKTLKKGREIFSIHFSNSLKIQCDLVVHLETVRYYFKLQWLKRCCQIFEIKWFSALINVDKRALFWIFGKMIFNLEYTGSNVFCFCLDDFPATDISSRIFLYAVPFKKMKNETSARTA